MFVLRAVGYGRCGTEGVSGGGRCGENDIQGPRVELPSGPNRTRCVEACRDRGARGESAGVRPAEELRDVPGQCCPGAQDVSHTCCVKCSHVKKANNNNKKSEIDFNVFYLL